MASQEVLDRSDQPLISTQDFDDISSQNNGINTEESVEKQLSSDLKTTDEWFDGLDDQKLPKVRHNSNILSQEVMTHRVDQWKGCSVINFKQFKKFSQNS